MSRDIGCSNTATNLELQVVTKVDVRAASLHTGSKDSALKA